MHRHRIYHLNLISWWLIKVLRDFRLLACLELGVLSRFRLLFPDRLVRFLEHLYHLVVLPALLFDLIGQVLLILEQVLALGPRLLAVQGALALRADLFEYASV